MTRCWNDEYIANNSGIDKKLLCAINISNIDETGLWISTIHADMLQIMMNTI